MKSFFVTTALAVSLAVGVSAASADEVQDKAKELAASQIKSFVENPAVIAAVKEQNAKNAELSQADVDGLDTKWRDERKSASSPMIDEVSARPISAELTKFRDSGQGLYTEVFLMDDKGLNVGMSDPTSDYWQGDEAKWKETYLVGADAVHVSDVEKDDSTGTFQLQVSMTVSDNGQPVGAITVGVDADQLMTR